MRYENKKDRCKGFTHHGHLYPLSELQVEFSMANTSVFFIKLRYMSTAPKRKEFGIYLQELSIDERQYQILVNSLARNMQEMISPFLEEENLVTHESTWRIFE